MHINPVFQREIKQNSRMKKTIVLLTGFNVLLIIFGLFAFYLTLDGTGESGNSFNYSDILSIYAIITAIEYTLLLFITPGITAGSIAGEREKQTLDLLLTSKMTTKSIIRGKLWASIGLLMLLAISSLPVIGIVFAIGGITFMNVLHFMVLLITTAIFIGSIGIFFSCICKRTTMSTVCTYTTLLIITIGLASLMLGEHIMEPLLGVQSDMYNGNTTLGIGVGPPILLLLLNPVFTFLSMLKNQIGFSFAFFGNWKTTSQTVYYVLQHWFFISILLQLVIAFVLNIISAQVIKPRGRK